MTYCCTFRCCGMAVNEAKARRDTLYWQINAFTHKWGWYAGDDARLHAMRTEFARVENDYRAVASVHNTCQAERVWRSSEPGSHVTICYEPV